MTVGICAHNEAATIGSLLEQVLAEDIPLSEIVVVVAGDDGTADVVDRFVDRGDPVVLVEEGERRGQSAAQTEIIRRASSDTLLLVDGDGVMEPGSLKALLRDYDGDEIRYGREVPVTPDTFTGHLIDEYWTLHHRLSRTVPKFTTQLACIPAHLVDGIPPDIVTDDEWLGFRAHDAGLDIRYVPEAVKYHLIKGDVGSYLRHHRKNWAGLLQLRRREGRENLQPRGIKARFYLEELFRASPRRTGRLAMLGVLETVALALATVDHLRGAYPAVWRR